MKLITVIGARPQFIKAATISREIRANSKIDEIIVHTGQHYDPNMSKVFFDELDIPIPDYSLGIGGGNHGEQTGQMLIDIEKVILEEKPDLVLVYGDTNSTLAGALSAAKLHIPVAHVEAGLRSFNKSMPEEINRILTDHISDFLFAPTSTAQNNLYNEGIYNDKIFLTGDVMYDAAIFYSRLAENRSQILRTLHLNRKEFILVTIHRAENTDDENRLKKIFLELEKSSRDYIIVLPLHPRTKKCLEAMNFDFDNSHILFTEPLGYLDMVFLEKNSRIIITDSGGVQKEAYFHKVPCLTLRNETEWMELVHNGYNVLVKNLENLTTIIKEELAKEIQWESSNLYGEGNAAKNIIYALEKNRRF